MSNLEQVRKQIQDRINLQEEAKKLELMRKRIEIAGKGVLAYSEKNLGEAARAFKGYVKILEDLKGVPEGGLSPSHFDKKTEMPELMLVSGVYWDLVKLYDRTRTKETYSEFKSFLGKYILFSKGMPFQTMAAETMRKYIRANRPIHKTEFKNAHKQIAVSQCFIATELDEYSAESTLPALRKFRDETLAKRPAGRSFIAWYYRNGPCLAQAISGFPEPLKRAMGRGLDLFARLTDSMPD